MNTRTRLSNLLVVLFMTVGLTACGGEKPDEIANKPATTKAATKEGKSSNPLVGLPRFDFKDFDRDVPCKDKDVLKDIDVSPIFGTNMVPEDYAPEVQTQQTKAVHECSWEGTDQTLVAFTSPVKNLADAGEESPNLVLVSGASFYNLYYVVDELDGLVMGIIAGESTPADGFSGGWVGETTSFYKSVVYIALSRDAKRAFVCGYSEEDKNPEVLEVCKAIFAKIKK